MPTPTLTIVAAALAVACAAVVVRRSAALKRWSIATVLFVILTSLGMSATSEQQSIWLNAPIVGAAIFAAFFSAALPRFEQRPALAVAVSLGASFLGLIVGMVVAIELGLLRP